MLSQTFNLNNTRGRQVLGFDKNPRAVFKLPFLAFMRRFRHIMRHSKRPALFRPGFLPWAEPLKCNCILSGSALYSYLYMALNNSQLQAVTPAKAGVQKKPAKGKRLDTGATPGMTECEAFPVTVSLY